jgi:tRNA pseudouridine38-40 synthase
MLAEVGRGNLTYDGFQRLLKFPSNAPAKFTAPPSGLFLKKVLYRGDMLTDKVSGFRLEYVQPET